MDFFLSHLHAPRCNYIWSDGTYENNRSRPRGPLYIHRFRQGRHSTLWSVCPEQTCTHSRPMEAKKSASLDPRQCLANPGKTSIRCNDEEILNGLRDFDKSAKHLTSHATYTPIVYEHKWHICLLHARSKKRNSHTVP